MKEAHKFWSYRYLNSQICASTDCNNKHLKFSCMPKLAKSEDVADNPGSNTDFPKIILHRKSLPSLCLTLTFVRLRAKVFNWVGVARNQKFFDKIKEIEVEDFPDQEIIISTTQSNEAVNAK